MKGYRAAPASSPAEVLEHADITATSAAFVPSSKLISIRSVTAKLSKLDAPDTQEHDIHAAILKTVEVFACICKTKIWVVNQKNSIAFTDGHAITMDMDMDGAYTIAEHEISHILFQSDCQAKAKFVESTVERLKNTPGNIINPGIWSTLSDLVIGWIEDHRVNYLWGQLYFGSALQLARIQERIVSQHLADASSSLTTYMMVTGTSLPVPDCQFNALLAPMRKSLAMVEGRGFSATLAAATYLINEIYKHFKPTPEKTAQDSGGKSTSAGGTAPAKGEVLGQSQDATKDHGMSEAKSVTAGEAASQLQTHTELGMMVNDVKPSQFRTRGSDKHSKDVALTGTNAGYHLINGDEAKANELLAEDAATMSSILEQARKVVAPKLDHDAWVAKESKAKVTFHNVPSVPDTGFLSAEDKIVIQRLRSSFNKILGRRQTFLEDSGSEVDVSAFIQRKASQAPIPCFKGSKLSKGFKVLILLDRSSSMDGPFLAQAQRACKLVSQSLKFPFVQVMVWGFQSPEASSVLLTRYPVNAAEYEHSDQEAGGSTPLHVSIQTAARFLSEGEERKYIFAITDGVPHYYVKSGKVPDGQMKKWVQEAVEGATKAGIQVRGFLIGNTLDDQYLNDVFLKRSNWIRSDEETLDKNLVDFVAKSFSRYLTYG